MQGVWNPPAILCDTLIGVSSDGVVKRNTQFWNKDYLIKEASRLIVQNSHLNRTPTILLYELDLFFGCVGTDFVLNNTKDGRL
jgi:hypothetical protein